MRKLFYVYGISEKEKNTYQIDPKLARDVAKDANHRKYLMSKNIAQVKVQYAEIDSKFCEPTGDSVIQEKAIRVKTDLNPSFNKENAFHCFAGAVDLNSSLQTKLSGGVHYCKVISMEKKGDDIVVTVDGEKFSTNLKPLYNKGTEDTDKKDESLSFRP